MVCNFGHHFCITHIKQFFLAHGQVALTNDMQKAYMVAQVWTYLSGWLQEAYFLKTKSNNNNLCILRTTFSLSQTLDDDPHNVYILHQRRWWFDRRSLLFLHCRVWTVCMFFLFSVSCLCSANSGPLDHNKRLQPILAEMFLTNSWQHVVVTMVSLIESVHFNNVWEMSVQIPLEANDLRTY